MRPEVAFPEDHTAFQGAEACLGDQEGLVAYLGACAAHNADGNWVAYVVGEGPIDYGEEEQDRWDHSDCLLGDREEVLVEDHEDRQVDLLELVVDQVR